MHSTYCRIMIWGGIFWTDDLLISRERTIEQKSFIYNIMRLIMICICPIAHRYGIYQSFRIRLVSHDILAVTSRIGHSVIYQLSIYTGHSDPLIQFETPAMQVWQYLRPNPFIRSLKTSYTHGLLRKMLLIYSLINAKRQTPTSFRSIRERHWWSICPLCKTLSLRQDILTVNNNVLHSIDLWQEMLDCFKTEYLMWFLHIHKSYTYVNGDCDCKLQHTRVFWSKSFDCRASSMSAGKVGRSQEFSWCLTTMLLNQMFLRYNDVWYVQYVQGFWITETIHCNSTIWQSAN